MVSGGACEPVKVLCHGGRAGEGGEVRGYLGEGDEDELALGEAGVREEEAGFVDLMGAVKEEVEVEGAGSVGEGVGAVAAKFELDDKEGLEEGEGGEGGLKLEDGVDEVGLVGKADGGGAVKGGAAGDAAELAEAEGGGGEGGLRGADGAGEVGAEADVGEVGHLSRVLRERQGRGRWAKIRKINTRFGVFWFSCGLAIG